jgi:hypothetical protein
MNMLKRLASLLLFSLVAACGGGGGDAGTPPFGGGTTTPPSTAATIDVVASDVQVGSGGDQVTITATVKDAGNVGLPSATVVFSTDSGTLSGASVSTDANGVATATLSAGADKSNRDITVTVTAGSAAGKLVLPVAGTSLAYTGATTVPLGSTATVGVKATDSKGNVIAGLAVTASSSLGNGLSATAITTNSQGVASVSYTASSSGTDTLKFTGGNAVATQTMQVSAANFQFISPAANATVVVGASQTLTVQYLSNGAPQVGKTVLFTATAGAITASAVTDANGQASATITSTIAGSALIQATLSNAGVSAQATLLIAFVSQTPAKLVLQASPSAIGPNAGGATAQQSQLSATVTDAIGNVVSGVTVNFTRVADPSGGSLSQASAVTDSSGQAAVQFVAGPLTTASNGVQLRATVSGAPTVFGDTTLTVNQSALFVALGTGNVISNLDPQTYKKDWVVYVTDANGIAVPNINLTIKVLPLQYGKGSLTWSGTVWYRDPNNTSTCLNEDRNYNGVLDSLEDDNNSGTLEPGNVISVSTTGTSSGSSSGTVKTDSTGRATISLVYAESYAPWVQVKLRAEAVVSGTESSKEAIFWVTGLASDFSSETVAPAGLNSPFGSNACNLPN